MRPVVGNARKPPPCVRVPIDVDRTITVRPAREQALKGSGTAVLRAQLHKSFLDVYVGFTEV